MITVYLSMLNIKINMNLISACTIYFDNSGAARNENFIKMMTSYFIRGETPKSNLCFCGEYPPDESYLMDQFCNGESLCNLHLNHRGWLLCVHGRVLKDRMAQYGKGYRQKNQVTVSANVRRRYICNVLSDWLRLFVKCCWYDVLFVFCMTLH